MEKYSVLMSLYEKEKAENLRLSLQSMVDQSVQPDEIVVVKDGKIPQALEDVLEEFVAEYPALFTVVGYEENKGLGIALNFGLEYARNELVARMDTDDIARPDRCEAQLKIFEENPQIDILGGDIAEFIGEKENVVGERNVPRTHEELVQYTKKRCPFNHQTVMYKKSAVAAAGGYQDWFWNEDYYLWLRMYLNGCRFANTGSVLVDVRVGAEMYSRRGGKKYYQSEKKLQKYMLKNKIIGYPTYCSNVLKRFIVQKLLPNKLRAWVFKKFARKSK